MANSRETEKYEAITARYAVYSIRKAVFEKILTLKRFSRSRYS